MDLHTKAQTTLSFLSSLAKSCTNCGQRKIPLNRKSVSMTGFSAGDIVCPECSKSIKEEKTYNTGSHENLPLEALRLRINAGIDSMPGALLQSLALEMKMYRVLLRNPSEMYLRGYLRDEVNQLDVAQLDAISFYLQRN